MFLKSHLPQQRKAKTTVMREKRMLRIEKTDIPSPSSDSTNLDPGTIQSESKLPFETSDSLKSADALKVEFGGPTLSGSSLSLRLWQRLGWLLQFTVNRFSLLLESVCLSSVFLSYFVWNMTIQCSCHFSEVTMWISYSIVVEKVSQAVLIVTDGLQ